MKIRSKGDGDDENFILLIAAWISLTLISSQQTSFSGGGGDSIHEKSVEHQHDTISLVAGGFYFTKLGLGLVSEIFTQKMLCKVPEIVMTIISGFTPLGTLLRRLGAHLRQLYSHTKVLTMIWIFSLGRPCPLAVLNSFPACFFSCVNFLNALSCLSLSLSCFDGFGCLVLY